MTTQYELFAEAPLVCASCGAISPTEFMHHLNHRIIPGEGICMSAWLINNHKEKA